MNIGIVGGGAIGLLFSFYLSNRHDVVLYTKTNKQAIQINENGVQLNQPKYNIMSQKINAMTYSNGIKKHELLIICVKQYDLDSVFIQSIQGKSKNILFLQNGIGHLRLLDTLHTCSIHLGIVEHGALKTSDYEVTHTGIGQTKLSTYLGEPNLMKSLEKEEFTFVYENDWKSMVFKKLLANCIINPLTAIFEIKNGELVSNPYFHDMMRQLFNEIIDVLPLKKETDYWDYVCQLCIQTKENQSSMLRDLLQNRPTEIDAILLPIIKLATHPMPITQFLYQAIKAKEKRNVIE